MSPTDLRYPIGKFDFSAPVPDERRDAAIRELADLPRALAAAVRGLSDEQLDTPYRPGGWTVRQVVHHVADSHINAVVRFKLALTEDEPTAKPYDQERWSKLADTSMPVEVSLQLLDALHQRWERLWAGLDAAEFERAFLHPDHGRISLRKMADWYGWHSRHHVAHVVGLRVRSGW